MIEIIDITQDSWYKELKARGLARLKAEREAKERGEQLAEMERQERRERSERRERRTYDRRFRERPTKTIAQMQKESQDRLNKRAEPKI